MIRKERKRKVREDEKGRNVFELLEIAQIEGDFANEIYEYIYEEIDQDLLYDYILEDNDRLTQMKKQLINIFDLILKGERNFFDFFHFGWVETFTDEIRKQILYLKEEFEEMKKDEVLLFQIKSKS